MYRKYTVIGYSNDFGTIKKEGGKCETWSGKRAVMQELTFDENTKTAVQGLTLICKCSSEFREVPAGSTGSALFDRNGKLFKIECGK